MKSASMKRAFLLLLACLGSWPAGEGFVRAQSAAVPDRGQIEFQLRMERKLLALDLSSYREARGREQRVQAQVEEAAGKLDEALAGDALTLGNLEALHDALVAARAAAAIEAERVEAQAGRLEDRLRRISFFEGELRGGAQLSTIDPVSGRWQVRILPQEAAGIFALSLNGTVVAGSYDIGSGASRGSFRGTYSNGTLRLERIDSRGGFDSVFEGTVDPAGRIQGTWTAKELASGQPARGDWTAVRISARSEGEP